MLLKIISLEMCIYPWLWCSFNYMYATCRTISSRHVYIYIWPINLTANKRSQLTCFTPLYRLRQVISIDPFSRQCRDIRAIFRVLWRQGSNIRLPVVSNNCRLPERKLRYCLGNPNGLTEWRHVRSRIWYLCYDMCVHAERKSPVVDLGLGVTVSSICRTFHSISTNLVFKKKRRRNICF